MATERPVSELVLLTIESSHVSPLRHLSRQPLAGPGWVLDKPRKVRLMVVSARVGSAQSPRCMAALRLGRNTLGVPTVPTERARPDSSADLPILVPPRGRADFSPSRLASVWAPNTAPGPPASRGPLEKAAWGAASWQDKSCERGRALTRSGDLRQSGRKTQACKESLQLGSSLTPLAAELMPGPGSRSITEILQQTHQPGSCFPSYGGGGERAPCSPELTVNTAGAAGRVRGSEWVTKRTGGRCQGRGNLTKAGPGRPQPRLRGVWSGECPGWGEASLLMCDLRSPGKRSLELVLLRPKAAGATLCHLPQPQGPHTGLSCPPRAGSIVSGPAERRCPARLPGECRPHSATLWRSLDRSWPWPAAIPMVPAASPGLAADGLFSLGSCLSGFQSPPSLHLLGAARVSGACFGVWTVCGL